MVVLMSVAAFLFLTMPLDGQQFAAIQRLYFAKIAGEPDPLPQIVTVTSGGSDFDFTTSAVTSSGGDWLEVSPVQACCTTPAPISIKVSAGADLAAGPY
jgi:hypothetical protein